MIFHINNPEHLCGPTIHEVPQVIAAGNVTNPDVAQTSTIVKMARVLMLIPVLLIIGFIWKKFRPASPFDDRRDHSNIIPWRAFIFVAAVALNSVIKFPSYITSSIHTVDIFLLTMEWQWARQVWKQQSQKFKEVGGKPFILSFILFVFLVIGGWVMALQFP